MELRAGYKQTEVGVIPEDWEVDTLGRFWSVTDCKHVTAKFVVSGYPLASIREVQSRFVNLSEAKQTTRHFYTLLIEGGRKPRAGDLIISRNATVGEIAQVTDSHPEFAMGQDVCLLRKKEPAYSTDYMQSVFRSPIIVKQFDDCMVGSTFKRVNVLQIRNLNVAMPSPAEQQAIATALSDADALIEALEQLLAKKRQIKQGAMQELLTGQRRLPGFAGEWGNRFLSEICWFQEGPGVRAWQFTESGVKLLNGTNIYRGALYLDSTSRFISEREAYGPYAHFMADVGDIVIASSGITIDKFHEKVAYVEQGDLPFCMNTSTIRFKPKQGVLASEFLFHSLTSDGFKRQIGGQATGSAQLNFGPSHVAKVAIALPEYVEQAAIATVLSDMDAEIATLEAKLAKARGVKQGMMQELLTGRIRLLAPRAA